MRRFLSVVLSGCALMATPAVAQDEPPNLEIEEYPAWNHLDVRLVQRAGGRRESDLIPFISPVARLYVRDAGVQTTRGPRDRVCLDTTGGRHGLPRTGVGISPVGAPPDARVELRRVGAHCVLLPAADAYRVWRMRLDQAPTPRDWPHWTAPDVIRAMELMPEQDDGAVIERNLRRIIAAVSPQGVCTTITVHRTRFDATDGLMHGAYLSASRFLHRTRQTATFHAQSMDRRGLVSREITNANGRSFIDRYDGFLYHTFFNYPGARPNTVADVIATVFGAAPRPVIEHYWETFPLDDAALNTQLRVRECVGEPITAMVAGQQLQPHYILMDLQVTVPHWNQYDRGGQGVHAYWRADHAYTLHHELVHVHDFLVSAAEIAFQSAGRLNMGDPRVGLPEYASNYQAAAHHHGLYRRPYAGYNLHETYLASNHVHGNRPQVGAVGAAFHEAERTAGINTGFLQMPPRYYGDLDAVLASRIRSHEEADRVVAAFWAQRSQDE